VDLAVVIHLIRLERQLTELLIKVLEVALDPQLLTHLAVVAVVVQVQLVQVQPQRKVAQVAQVLLHLLQVHQLLTVAVAVQRKIRER
jgi:hypothetical protein